MENFWQGMLVKGVRKEKQDLIIEGEKTKLPCSREVILEEEPSDYSKDLKLKKRGLDPRLLGKRIIGKYFLFGIKFNPKTKRDEIVHLALTDGWCWDET